MAEFIPVGSFDIVIFGGTGDLSRRKLLPALYHRWADGQIPEDARIIGISRSEMSDAEFRTFAFEACCEASPDSVSKSEWKKFETHLHYVTMDATDPNADWADLKSQVKTDAERPLVFYLAVTPKIYVPICQALGQAGLSEGNTRVVLEKPIGTDLASAHEINEGVGAVFPEECIYRIDHYLGKETVQNLLVFRFANPVFESLWNRDRVESVEITVAESLGVEKRAGYYDKAGALRDMVQNHLTQLLTLTAMEVPAAFEANAIRDEKVKVLKSIAPIDEDQIIFGQYEQGHVNDKKVPGYLAEENVPSDSITETFVALQLQIDSWRWQGVPFYLRTGKRLDRRLTKIVVNFRKAPVSLFPRHRNRNISPNRLILTLQPNEGFELEFEVKSPGQEMSTQTQRLHFEYGEAFGPLQEGYETLLFDVITNDQTLFVRSDEVETSWELYEPLLNLEQPIYGYESGSWGPQEAHFMLAKNGHRWNEK